jgi:O-antigen/teichoic acid export membrane protein
MEIGAVAWTNVVTAVGSVVLVYPAILGYQAGHQTALVLLLGGSLVLGLAFAFRQAHLRGCLASFSRTPARTIDPAAVAHFLKIGLPSLIALFVGIGSVLVVRALIARVHGLPAAGQFDSAWSISTLYLTVFLTAIHSYLLPALSGRSTESPAQEVVERALRLAVIVSLPLISAMIVLKPLAVRLLYSGEFLPALEVLRWTLLGDYLRVAGWVLATSLVARADMRAYLACELIWNALFVAGAFWLTRDGIGACIVLLASLATWNDTSVAWVNAGLVVVAAVFSWFAITPAEKALARERFSRLSIRA